MPEVRFPSETELFSFLSKAIEQVTADSLLLDSVKAYLSEDSDISHSKYSNTLHSYFEFLRSKNAPAPSSVTSTNADPDRIYIDGCWDIMHSGHFNAIRQAKQLGKWLVVGVHTSEEICRNKGNPVMTLDERTAMVRACKWVDEVVTGAPYSPTLAWLDQVNCLYIAHGDDLAVNDNGVDAYNAVKSAGRFKVIKRTEGVSTTAIVGKLLLMTQEQRSAYDEPLVTANVDFLTTSRRISEFSDANVVRMRENVVYVDGSFDLFHIGHVETLKKAKELGDFLVVGVHDDITVNRHKGYNYPIMNLHERVLNVLAVKYVDEVVIGAPWNITQDLMKSLNIRLVVQGTISKLDTDITQRRKQSLDIEDGEEDPYTVPIQMGAYQQVTSERTIETKDIVQRIIENRLRYLTKYNVNSQKEARYYNEKVFVEEI